MSRALAPLSILALAAAVVGCGGGSDYSSPEATFETMWRAAKAGNADAMMACYSKDTREKFAELKKLAAEMAELSPEAGKDGDLDKGVVAAARNAPAPEYGEEKIDGDKATLEIVLEIDVKGKKTKKKETVDFVKEDGGWKIKLPLPDPAEVRSELEEAKKKKSEKKRDYSSPKATLETMIAASKVGDKDALYACFDKNTREGFADMEKVAKEMAATMPKSAQQKEQGGGKIKDAKVTYGEAKIEGDKATMDVTVEGDTLPVKFVKEGGAWKISMPELKAAAALMKAMAPMMKGMGGAFKKMGEDMKKAIEKGKK